MDKFYQELAKYRGEFMLKTRGNVSGFIRHKDTDDCPLVAVYGSILSNKALHPTLVIFAADNYVPNASYQFKYSNSEVKECRAKMLEVLGLTDE